MKLDLTKLKAAADAHTAATQELLNSNAAHAAAAGSAASELAAAQAEIDTLTAEVASQTTAIVAFNLGSAPAA